MATFSHAHDYNTATYMKHHLYGSGKRLAHVLLQSQYRRSLDIEGFQRKTNGLRRIKGGRLR